MPQYVAFHLGLHCLPKYPFRGSGTLGVKRIHYLVSHVSYRLRDDRTRFNLNLEVQLMLKQGQVEVDAGSFIHDYKDSALIHRNVVEDLNTTIKVKHHIHLNI